MPGPKKTIAFVALALGVGAFLLISVLAPIGQGGGGMVWAPREPYLWTLLRRPQTRFQEIVQAIEYTGREPDDIWWIDGSLLSAAVRREREDVVEWLLGRGASPNGSDVASSPLAVAVRQGNGALVEMLLRHGADPDLDTGGGVTARTRAAERRPELLSIIDASDPSRVRPFVTPRAIHRPGRYPLDPGGLDLVVALPAFSGTLITFEVRARADGALVARGDIGGVQSPWVMHWSEDRSLWIYTGGVPRLLAWHPEPDAELEYRTPGVFRPLGPGVIVLEADAGGRWDLRPVRDRDADTVRSMPDFFFRTLPERRQEMWGPVRGSTG